MALALTLPGEADIARDIGRDVDPDAIFAARTHLRGAIGRRLGQALRETYRRMQDDGPFSPDAASAGRRALKNACLDLLAAGGASAIALAARQYHNATNMTDRVAALATLALHGVPERQAAFDDFYRRYAADPLIIDKWLGLQAAIPEAATLDRVRRADAAPGVLVLQSEPRQGADRRVRAGKPDAVQPPRRRRLRLPGRHHPGARRRRTRSSPRACRPRFARGACSSRRGALTRRPHCGASRRRRISRAT